jgi:hypothetical protein
MCVTAAPGVALGICLGLLLLVPLPAARAACQDAPPDVEKGWETDPYTGGDAESAKSAGYVSVGRHMVWGDDHGTREITTMLGAVPVIWLETPHFRVGSTLPEYDVKLEEKDKLRAELKRLRLRLPKVKERSKSLDRWLRLHLYAQRLEETYTELSDFLGVSDADFPAEGAERAEDAPYMGSGPFLGRRGKYLVLLFEKQSGLGRYAERCGSAQGGDSPLQHAFHKNGSLLFATTSEFFKDRFGNDTALHCHVTWNVVQVLLNGFKDYYHAPPRWVSDGIGYWYMRRVHEEYPSFSLLKEPSSQVADENDWARKVRARVKVDVYPPSGELMRWKRDEPLEFANHTMMWSRVDFLMQEHPAKFARFLHRLKDPIPLDGRTPTMEDVFARQDEAMAAELFAQAEFDEAWSAWVLKTYPKK